MLVEGMAAVVYGEMHVFLESKGCMCLWRAPMPAVPQHRPLCMTRITTCSCKRDLTAGLLSVLHSLSLHKSSSNAGCVSGLGSY
jgi:hypothetical protein